MMRQTDLLMDLDLDAVGMSLRPNEWCTHTPYSFEVLTSCSSRSRVYRVIRGCKHRMKS